MEEVKFLEQEVRKIRKWEIFLKRKNRKTVGPGDIPVEMWKWLGEKTVEYLTKLFNMICDSEKMPDEWKESAHF